MKHYIYSVNTSCSSKWSKGYLDFYLIDVLEPIPDNPALSVVILQIQETNEIYNEDVKGYRPSKEVLVRICRATYNERPIEYGIKEQLGYIFSIDKSQIPNIISQCQNDVDSLLNQYGPIDVNSRDYCNWNFKVSRN
jgi:hypothetical protein